MAVRLSLAQSRKKSKIVFSYIIAWFRKKERQSYQFQVLRSSPGHQVQDLKTIVNLFLMDLVVVGVSVHNNNKKETD